MTKLRELMLSNIFYKDSERYDRERDFIRPRNLYKEAREEIRLWLEEVIKREIDEYRCSEASVTLYLPGDDLTVRLLGSGSICPERFRTPIGYLDSYVYEEILKDGNPVKDFIDFIYTIMRQWEPKLSKAAQFAGSPLISEELLWSARFRDVIGISRLFPLMRSYEDCMKGLYL